MDSTFLIEQYYNSISLMQDKETIEKTIPEATFFCFFEIMEGLIFKLEKDRDELEYLLSDEEEGKQKNIWQEELESCKYKIDLCKKRYKEAKEKQKAEDDFLNEEWKKIIFAMKSNDEPFIFSDIKSSFVPEEYYQNIIDSLQNIETGGNLDNKEKGRRLRSDSTINDVFEVKTFKVRVYYRILSKDIAYVFLAKQKKSDNDAYDKNAIRNRRNYTDDEYKKLKKLISDPEQKREICRAHRKYLQDILEYLGENKRGVKNEQL